MTIKNPEFHDCECGFRWAHGKNGDHNCGPYYRQTIRELQAAAPQVVADDRELQHAAAWESLRADVLHGIDGLDNDQVNIVLGMIDHYAPDSAALAAAPVQAQEPVAFAIYSEDGRNVRIWFTDRPSSVKWAQANQIDPALLVPLYRAPVQPVAVPDVWTCTKEHDLGTVTDAQGNHIARSYYKEIKALTDRHNASIAAPAAQGDAQGSTDDDYKEGDPGWRPECCDGGGLDSSCCDSGEGCAADCERAAIAAKAAS